MKSNYDSLVERNRADAKTLTLPTKWRLGRTRVDVDQGILFLKGAACVLIDSIQKGEHPKYFKSEGEDLRTFRGDGTFGFTEAYVNYLMLIARSDGYDRGKTDGYRDGVYDGVEKEKKRMRVSLNLD